MMKSIRIMLCFLMLASYIPLFSMNEAEAASMPTGWSSLGFNSSSGSSSYDNSTGTFTITSTGNGIVNQTSVNEQFQYAYTALSGDFTMVAKMSSFPYFSGATAGILVRSTLDQGSSFVYGAYYGTGNKYQPYTISKTAASTNAASNSGYKVSGVNVTYDTPPSHMRVRKQWNSSGKADVYFDMGTSDGTTITWTNVNAKGITDVTSSQTMYVGLAVGTTATAMFDSITLSNSYTSETTTAVSSLKDVLATPLDTPIISAASADNQVSLSWQSVTGATYYNVKRSETMGDLIPSSILRILQTLTLLIQLLLITRHTFM